MFTNHKNLTFDSIKTQWVLHWRNRVEQYSHILHYIEGPKNILTENLSRLHRLITPAQLAKAKILVDQITAEEEDADEEFFLNQEYSGVLDEDIHDSLECYLNLLDSENPEQNTLSFAYIRDQQQADAKLLAVQLKLRSSYIYKCLDDDVEDIICYVKDHDNPTTGK